MSAPAGKWRLLAAIVVAGLLADQATKFLAVDRLTWAFQRAGARTLPERVRAFYTLSNLEGLAREPYVVFRSWWRMSYVENPNAAFSLGSFLPPGPRHAVFLVFAAVAVVALVWFYRRLDEGQRYQQITLALVLTGAAGNVVDRLWRRYVIDFVEWYWWNRPDLRWPTFNLADSMLSVGIVLLLLSPEGRAKPRPPG
jgi:signal peptidase II